MSILRFLAAAPCHGYLFAALSALGEDLYWNLKVMYDLASCLRPQSDRTAGPRLGGPPPPPSSQVATVAAAALECGNAVCNILDPSDERTLTMALQISLQFFRSAALPASSSADPLNPTITKGAGVLAPTAAVQQVIAVGHCHIDTAWLWPYRETRRKIVRSWSTQLRYMSRYPGLPFTFAASQAVQFDWLQQDHPELMPALEAAVAAGRFIPVGGSWVEPDANMPSGEALARQFLLGERRMAELLGQAGRSTVFWLPDTFGYSAQLPQIARLCGKPYFLTQKLSWSLVNRPRHNSFWWAGLDGTRVLVHFPPADTYNAQGNVQDVLRSATQNKSARDTPTALMLYGNGDGGGGPTIEMLLQLARLMGSRAQNRHAASADGTGQLATDPSNLVAPPSHPAESIPAHLQGLPAVQHGDPHRFFEGLEHMAASRKLHKHSGELYLELHQGTLTTKAGLKLGNRVSERLLGQVEFLGVSAALACLQLASGLPAPLPTTSTLPQAQGSEPRPVDVKLGESVKGPPSKAAKAAAKSTPASATSKAAKAAARSTPAHIGSPETPPPTAPRSTPVTAHNAFGDVPLPKQLPHATGSLVPTKATLEERCRATCATPEAALAVAWSLLGPPTTVLKAVQGAVLAPATSPTRLQKLKATLPPAALAQLVKLVRKNDKHSRLLARQGLMFRVLGALLASKSGVALKKPFINPGTKKRQMFAGKVTHAHEGIASATLTMWHPDYVLLHVKYADGDQEDLSVNDVQKYMSPPLSQQELGWARDIVVAAQAAAFKIISAAIATVDVVEAVPTPQSPGTHAHAAAAAAGGGDTKLPIETPATSPVMSSKGSKKRQRSKSKSVAAVPATTAVQSAAGPASPLWLGALTSDQGHAARALLSLASEEDAACTLPQSAVGGFKSRPPLSPPGQLLGPAAVYPELALRKLWQGVCLNQFHDVLPGSSISIAHDDALQLYEHMVGRALSLREQLAAGVSSLLQVPGAATARSKMPLNTRVWNASSVPQLALVKCSTASRPKLVRPPAPMRLPQPVAPVSPTAPTPSPKETSHIFQQLGDMLDPLQDGAGATVVPLPSWGGCDVHRSPRAPPQLPPRFHVSAKTVDSGIVLSNAFLAVHVCNMTGHVTSLKVKAPSAVGRAAVAPQEVLPLGGVGNKLTMHRDIPLFWDAWDTFPWTDEAWTHANTGRYVAGAGDAVAAASLAATAAARGTPLDTPSASVGNLLTRELHSSDSSKAVLRPSVTLTLHSSSSTQAVLALRLALPGRRSFLHQHIILDALSPTLHFHTAVLWRETHVLLRVGFPVCIAGSSAEYDCAWGSVLRPLHTSSPEAEMQQEVTGHSYACMVQDNMAVALLNDSKYGYNCLPGVMRLSLLRASQAPDKHADCAHHTFKYGITVATPGIQALLQDLWSAVCGAASCVLPRATACGQGDLRDLIIAQAKQFNVQPFGTSVQDNRTGVPVVPFELFSASPSPVHALPCTSVLLDGVKLCEAPLQASFKCSALRPAQELFDPPAPLSVPCFVLRLYESTGCSGWCVVHSSTPLASVTAVNILEQPFGSKGDVAYSGYEHGADHPSVVAVARRVGDAATGMQHRGPMPPAPELQPDGKSIYMFVSAHQVVSLRCVPQGPHVAATATSGATVASK